MQWFKNNLDDLFFLAAIGLTASLIGIGQLLASEEALTTKIMCGRALSSGGLGLCAGFFMTIFDVNNLIAGVGLAAVIASLGTSALEKLIQKILGIK